MGTRARMPVSDLYAQWTKYGKSAGPIRNAEMLRFGKPQLVVAFPGGDGTENMIGQAKPNFRSFDFRILNYQYFADRFWI